MSSIYISKKMEQTIQALNEAPWENKTFYQAWLAQTYFYTRYSTRLLAWGAGWSPNDDNNFYHRALNHIREEQGHELVAVNDIKNLGGSIDSYQQFGVTAAMWQSQYEKTLRNTSYLLGYILPLETLACVTFKPLFERLRKVYPENACMMVKIHADDDPDHVEKCMEQIERCSPAVREEILRVYDQTCELYRFMLQAVREETGT